MTMSAGQSGRSGPNASQADANREMASGRPIRQEEGYAGDVDPAQAWQALAADPAAVLVDVRSAAEWTFVGVPDLSEMGKRAVLVSWQSYPGMAPNSEFLTSVASQVPDPAAPIYFLCRSGARSRAAAIACTVAGHTICFNVAGGFEGGLDGAGHRGTGDGWKASGLPWVQS